MGDGDTQGGGLQELVAGRGRAARAARGQHGQCEGSAGVWLGSASGGAGGIHSHLAWAGSTLLGRCKWAQQELAALQNPLVLG